jgi:hypothetical protein
MMAFAGAMGVAGLAALHLIENLSKLRQAKLMAEAGGLGSGISNEEIDKQVKLLKERGSVEVEQAGKVVNAFASMQGTGTAVLGELTADVRNLALRLGEDVPQAAAKIVSAWNLDAGAGGELLQRTRASADAIRAFSLAAQDGDAIKARTILLQELSRSSR